VIARARPPATAIAPGGLLAGRKVAGFWLARRVGGSAFTALLRMPPLLKCAKRSRSIAKTACSPEYNRMLANIAADFERLARYQLIILNTHPVGLTRRGCRTAIDQLPT
jgi:hypothetical protein